MSCMFVTSFEAITPVTFGFKIHPSPPKKKFGVKSGLVQKRFKYGKNISHDYTLRYPLIPTNSLLAAMSFIFLAKVKLVTVWGSRNNESWLNFLKYVGA